MRKLLTIQKHLNRLIFLVLFSMLTVAFGQGIENESRYIRIGELQSHFSAYGSERAWNNSYYAGLRWPAEYSYTDNAVIKRAWVAVADYTDENSVHWDNWATYITAGFVEETIFPVEMKQTTKFELPYIYVDGNDLSSSYRGDYDEIDVNQVPDRIVKNVVNTACGLTMTRTIYAFSQQYHDNYFIKIFTFKNTGNIDYDDEIELNAPLTGVRFGWLTRYSNCREAASYTASAQSYGAFSMVSKKGEEYASHADAVNNSTEANAADQFEYLRCGLSWLGQASSVSYNMTGGPAVRKYGRLTAPQFIGSGVIHVDKTASDKSDDVNQPAVLGWHAGDTYPSIAGVTDDDRLNMTNVWNMLSGVPYPTDAKGGSNRYWETITGDGKTGNITSLVDPSSIHGDGGGTGVWLGYGPFDLAIGDSVVVVEVEGISGISRKLCIDIGRRWYNAYLSGGTDTGPFTLPDGSTTTDLNVYKNSWVYTGMDSTLMTISRAVRNYNSGYNIPQPPQPPTKFYVNSGGDKISLSWEPSPSESESGFGGYRIYRAVSKPDTVFDFIAELPLGTTSYEDYTPVRGFNYYYYITAITDGSNNTSGVTNPTGILESNKFYTRTTQEASLQRKAGISFNDIRVVPNPYNIKAVEYQFTGDQKDQIAFYNIPAYCKIKIFTERGDLIKELNHTDGSGDELWNSVTSSRQIVTSGVYIAYIEVTDDCTDSDGNILFNKGESTFTKFIVIR